MNGRSRSRVPRRGRGWNEPQTTQEVVACYRGAPARRTYGKMMGLRREKSNPPPATPPPTSTTTSQQCKLELVDGDASMSPVAEIAPPLSPACSVPSPPMCESNPPPATPPPTSTTTSQQCKLELVDGDESMSPVAEIAPPLSPACSVPSPPMCESNPPPATPPPTSTTTSQQCKVELVDGDASMSPVAEIAPPLSPACSVPSPPMCESNPPPATPPPTSTTTSQQCKLELVDGDASMSPVAEIAPPLSPCSVPPPPMCEFVDCTCKLELDSNMATCDSAPNMPPTSPMKTLPPRPRQALFDVNLGSEAGSDESDEDDELVYPSFVPRVYRSTMETPLDQDEDDITFNRPTGDPAAGGILPAVTDQPGSWYDFQWSAFPDTPIPPESRRESFSESNVGPLTPLVDPYGIFVAIWDRSIMEHIASETNKYAQQVASQMLENNTLRPNSRISQWRETTVDELYVYFGLILAMGIVVKSRLEEYWIANHDVFYTPGFSAHMSFNRFVLINKCLHFNDNKYMCALELDSSEAKLYKIQPLLSHLNMKFQSLYTPMRNIALDESLLQWKGWLDNTSQIIPNKASSIGIKSYEICECHTGYLWRFEIHAHKNSPPQQFEDPLEAPTPSIVLRLARGLDHKGYTLWMDNYYNSPCLARCLKSLGFDCVGTLRTDRKFVPQALHNLTKCSMHPGQITGLTSGDVDVMVWRDNNRVAMISTYHGNGQQAFRGSTRPILILDYIIMMGGVDKKDHMLAMYPIERKRTKVWYKKLFRRLLNVSVLNSFIIHNRSASSLTHRNFRIALVKSLLAKHFVTPPRPITTQNQRIDVTHRLDEYPMVNQHRRRRVCKICKKRVHTFCVGCSKTVCMSPCFLYLHS